MASFFVPTSGGKISLEFTPNKKQQYAQVLVQFKSSESEIVNALLEGFIHEKCIVVGTSTTLKIANAITRGLQSIYFTVPDTKVLDAISSLYGYMLKTKLRAGQVKYSISKSASYKKLHSDLKSFDVIVTGKCISTMRKFEDKNDKIARFEKIVKSLPVNEKIEDKPIEVKKSSHVHMKEILDETTSLTPYQRFLFAILMMDCNFHFTDKGELCIDEGAKECFAEYISMYGHLINSRVKSFLQQGGSIGTKPSANDTNGLKLKERNANVIAIAKTNLNIINHLFGTNVKLGEITTSSFESLKPADTKPIISIFSQKKVVEKTTDKKTSKK